MNVAVLVSGQGSNLRALLSAIDRGSCAASVCAVIADRDGTPAIEHARERGLSTAVVRAKDYVDRDEWDRELARAIAGFQPELVVLAGFMRIVGAAVLARFEGRIINVHPALLPAFPGKDAPAQAIAKRVTLSGCTVHVVDAGVDTGPILAQAAVPVLASDDAASLHARIQHAEHELLPAVVHAVASGALELGMAPRYARTPAEVARPYYSPPIVNE